VTGTATLLPFHEEDGVPPDSKVIGLTWTRANKDGSRDKRNADNHKIPVTQYGLVTLKSQNGFWEEFHFSDPPKKLNFLNAFTASFTSTRMVISWSAEKT
jgi:hypothetical protein